MHPRENRLVATAVAIAMIPIPLSGALAQLPNGWKAHDLQRPQPKVVTPGESASQPPSDAITLFNGKDLTGWSDRNGKPSKWKVVGGVLESVANAGPIFTEQKFGDCQLHLEFASPQKVKGNGQRRGNSGVYLMGQYEVQVLDSYDNKTYADGSAAAIYGQHAPLVNASRKPGQWQSYDIVFRRPRFDEAGKLIHRARVTVLHNGVLVQDNSECYGPSNWIQHGQYDPDQPTAARLSLQDHGNPVRFRNIWIRRLVETPPVPRKYPPVIDLSAQERARYVGKYGKLEVGESDGHLFAEVVGRKLTLHPHSKTEFSFERTAGSLTFALDAQGRTTKCVGSVDAVGRVGGDKN